MTPTILLLNGYLVSSPLCVVTSSVPFWNPNATYLRLKSLELGYTLPKNLTRKVGISDLRVFVNGFNLLTFCNSLLKDADPEREERDWGASLAYPLMKSYNIGLNINF